MIGDDALVIGPVTVSFLDADVLTHADYSLQLDLWPGGRLILTQLGRRFDTFSQELGRVRNQARVAGLLAHGVTMPEVFQGVSIAGSRHHPAEFQLYDTHVTIVPADADPWQLPLGAIKDVHSRDEPPSIGIETHDGLTTLGQLGRRRDACKAAIVELREAQRVRLEELTGQAGFSDGAGVPRGAISSFNDVLGQFTAEERVACRDALLAAATGEPRVGFVQLLDPDADGLRCPAPLPNNWAVFLLAPVARYTVMEILTGPAAATYVFSADVDSVNRDLQLLHFRRAPLALSGDQAELTPVNPYRLALRRLEPLQRLRAATVARVVHTATWKDSLRAALDSQRQWAG